jgi:serine/threonine-protein kinase
MSDYRPSLESKLVDRLCDEFESAWQSGSPPRIEQYLTQVPEDSRAELFADLLDLDVEYRRAGGEQPTDRDYVSRFPTFEDTVREHLSRHVKSDTKARRHGPDSTANRRRQSGHDGSPQAADRNLLFGILALQMDFVGRDALIEAMNAWLLKKSTPIGEILVHQEALPLETRELLDALVNKHVELHGGDLEQSLASIGVVDSVRTDLQCLGDGDVEASLSLISTVRNDKSPAAPIPTRRGGPKGEGDRYRVVRPHAKGGIGEVFVAEDIELSREVALKEIQSNHADHPESRARFLLEAEVTGGLEHPGIVPVYGLGHYDDGRPYYAMRFIRGESLKEAITMFHASQNPRIDRGERRLELHKLLRRFVDVCNAIEYAHSRGVLHRDLKPGNVMLGKYGETLVVDWGLAKSGKRAESKIHLGEVTLKVQSASGTTPTQMGSVFGTPAYMSPEQAAGELDELGPKSDVYSLGATLYHMLTGNPPFKNSDVKSLIAQVQSGEFSPPCEVNSNVPQGLEAVCMKAMGRQPDERYASPLELAEDIEHWLADEPVSAWQEPVLERTRRWIRGHQMLVSSTAVALIVALVCAGAGLALLNEAWQGEQVARQDAQQNHTAAERHFEQARDAVNQFYTEVSEEALLHQPGLQPLRERLMKQALEYYVGFLKERGDDQALRAEVADTWFRVGVITELVHSPEQSLEAYQRARKLHQALQSDQPGDLPRLVALSDTINAMGRARQKLRQYDDAMTDYQESQRLRQQLVRAAPENVEYQRKLANSHMNVGLVNWRLGDPEAARQALRHSRKMRQKQLDVRHDLKTLRDQGMCFYNLAVFSLMAGDGPAGEHSLSEAIQVFERVLSENPRDAANEQRLATCYRLLADRRLAIPDIAGAADYYEKARARLDTLTIRNPDVPDFAAALASVYLNLAEAERRREQPKVALPALQSAAQILGKLVSTEDGASKYRLDFAVTLRTLAEIQIELDQSDAARRNLVAAQEQLAKLAEQHSDDEDVARQLAEITDLIRKAGIDDTGTD